MDIGGLRELLLFYVFCFIFIFLFVRDIVVYNYGGLNFMLEGFDIMSTLYEVDLSKSAWTISHSS